MKIPEGKTEEEVLKTIEIVVNRLARKYMFGYYDIDDMKQEARLAAWEALTKYDISRPLENYLWTCVHNSLFNLKRKKYERYDKPCLSCPLYDAACKVSHSQCEAYEDKMECSLYSSWLKRNTSKKNLMKPIDLGEVRDEHERNMSTNDSVSDEMFHKEIFLLLDEKLPVEIRSSFVKMRHGIKLPKADRIKVEAAIIKVLKEHGITKDD